MAETTEVVASTAEKKTKKTTTAAKKPKVKPTHPPTSEMVTSAIKTLKERGGSSLPAIKKYLAANYKVDVEKLAPFIKKYLKGAVVSGALVQTKGKGASGSFKLSKGATSEKPKAPKKAPVEKKKKASPAKKTADKKAKKEKPAKAAAKKAPASPKKVEKKKAVKAAAKAAKKTGEVKVKSPKSPAKATVKTGATKAKAAKPKAKKVASPAKKAAKK